MKIRTIIMKEWTETLRDRMILVSILIPPIIFTVVPAVLVRIPNMRTMQSETLDEIYAASPLLRAAGPEDVTKLILVSQFMIFFLMMPVFIPLSIAVQSIIGEKQNRTLEPLLATPIDTLELLLGKSLSAAIPAIIITWTSFAIFYASTLPIVGETLRGALLDPKWIVTVLVIAPLLCLLGVGMAVLLSSRLNDTRAAQQLGAVVIIPIVGIAVAQTAGKLVLGVGHFIIGALFLALIDAILLYLTVKVFDRETILTRWK